MILVRLDPSKGATALMSLPRDLVVDIPGHGRARLNTAFAIGEDKLTLRTVRQLLDIPIHHYIRVTFWGFRGAVDRLGCVYTDVDRRYFNDNNPPNGGGPDYATIDVDAGYQKLCGQDALDYVRYRHFDNDLVRAARQQSFLGDAKSQIGVSGVFDDREQLLKIFAQSVRTDIDGEGRDPEPAQARRGVLEQARAGGPVPRHGRRGRRGADLGTALRRTVDRFLDVKASSGPKGTTRSTTRKRRAQRRQRRSSSELPTGLVTNKTGGEDIGAQLQVKLRRLPVYYPKVDAATGGQLRRARRAHLRRARPHGPPSPGLPDGGLRGLHRAVLRRPGHGLEGSRRSSTTRPRSRACAAGATSCSTTAAACGWSRGGRSAGTTGCRTPSCGPSRIGRCLPWPGR